MLIAQGRANRRQTESRGKACFHYAEVRSELARLNSLKKQLMCEEGGKATKWIKRHSGLHKNMYLTPCKGKSITIRRERCPLFMLLAIAFLLHASAIEASFILHTLIVFFMEFRRAKLGGHSVCRRLPFQGVHIPNWGKMMHLSSLRA